MQPFRTRSFDRSTSFNKLEGPLRASFCSVCDAEVLAVQNEKKSVKDAVQAVYKHMDEYNMSPIDDICLCYIDQLIRIPLRKANVAVSGSSTIDIEKTARLVESSGIIQEQAHKLADLIERYGKKPEFDPNMTANERRLKCLVERRSKNAELNYLKLTPEERTIIQRKISAHKQCDAKREKDAKKACEKKSTKHLALNFDIAGRFSTISKAASLNRRLQYNTINTLNALNKKN